MTKQVTRRRITALERLRVLIPATHPTWAAQVERVQRERETLRRRIANPRAR